MSDSTALLWGVIALLFLSTLLLSAFTYARLSAALAVSTIATEAWQMSCRLEAIVSRLREDVAMVQAQALATDIAFRAMKDSTHTVIPISGDGMANVADIEKKLKAAGGLGNEDFESDLEALGLVGAQTVTQDPDEMV